MGRLPGGDAAVGDGTGHPEDGSEDRGGEIARPLSPVIVLGGFLSRPRLYAEMRDTLSTLSGRRIVVVPLTLRHWAAAGSGAGWKRILETLDATVRRARGPGRDRVILVAHSAGGVMARLYLSPDPFRGHRFRGLDAVEHLITLGSPHQNVRGARMRRWVNRTYPGAFFASDVTYTAVGGRALRGDRRGGVKQRAAYHLYRYLCDDGAQWGDGLVPLPSAHLAGARNLALEGVVHMPLPGATWYGSAGVVRTWWEATTNPKSDGE